MTTPQVPTITLNNGTTMPQLGLGTWPLDDEQVAEAVIAAAEAGFRHVDTAAKYGNERGVGNGVRDSGVAREDFFVTTKLDGPYQGDDKAIAGLDASLERLGLDYVDLLLIHWPLPARGLFVSTWRSYEKLLAEGKARAIGVSNFKPAHLEVLIAETSVVPAVNQVQLSPYIPRIAEREFDAAHGIVTESWSPLAPGTRLLDEPAVTAAAAAHGVTAGQVVLRWHTQSGLVAIPKSKTPSRLAENLDSFGFELTADEIAAIDALAGTGPSAVDSDVSGH
jgi:2,5-diketo-D-gluconate reductase A